MSGACAAQQERVHRPCGMPLLAGADGAVPCSCGHGLRGQHAGILRDPAGLQPDAEGAGHGEERSCGLDRHPVPPRDRDAAAGMPLMHVASHKLPPGACLCPWPQQRHLALIQHGCCCAGLWVCSQPGWIWVVQSDQAAAAQALRVQQPPNDGEASAGLVILLVAQEVHVPNDSHQPNLRHAQHLATRVCSSGKEPGLSEKTSGVGNAW